MQPVNLRAFKKQANLHKTTFRRFLGRIESQPPRFLDKLAEQLDPQVWQEVDCLSCANCCKTMSPTFTPADIKRIAEHLNTTPEQFKDKWLELDKKDGDWMNKKQPCQFLDLTTNKCDIYEVRPADCAGFPHLRKKKMADYLHVHKQNVEYCPATFRMVEKMKEQLSFSQGKWVITAP